MRDPFSRLFSSLSSSQDSLLHRIRENFHQLLTPARIFPSSANGAPIHLPRWERSARFGRAQRASLITHAAIITVLALIAVQPRRPTDKPDSPRSRFRDIFAPPPNLLHSLRDRDPNGGNGSGTGHDLLPPTRGDLPPLSSIQLLKPTIPQNRNPELPVPPTILDASAPRVLTSVDNLGLPWMPDRNNSSGRGKGNTIGDGPDDSIGSSPGEQTGVGGPQGSFQPGVTLPKCAYCPDPQYTDEAREAKVQGKVALRVLISADGRAAQVRVIQGIGFGLDERAAEAVRGWKFTPARDAGHRAVPTWVTIEAVFRLF